MRRSSQGFFRCTEPVFDHGGALRGAEFVDIRLLSYADQLRLGSRHFGACGRWWITIDSYRKQCELESFLFQILRRRIVDHYRHLGRSRELPACEVRTAEHELRQVNPINLVASDALSASAYARNHEQYDEDKLSLAAAIAKLANELQTAAKFRDLKIAEGLFYAQLRSLELAKVLKISENEVAVVKRRMIERLARSI